MGVGIEAWRSRIGIFLMPKNWRNVEVAEYSPNSKWSYGNELCYRMTACFIVLLTVSLGTYAVIIAMNGYFKLLNDSGMLCSSYINSDIDLERVSLSFFGTMNERMGSVNICNEYQFFPSRSIPCILTSVRYKPLVTKLLQLAGDIESNPGPESDIIKAMEAMKCEMLEQVQRTGQQLSNELSEVKAKQTMLQAACENLNKQFSSLKSAVDHVQLEVDTLKTNEHIARLDFAAIDQKFDMLFGRLDVLDKDSDVLEGFSRRDNIRLYGESAETK